MITLKRNDAGNFVTAFKNKPEYGYLVLHSVENTFENGWLQAKERTTLLRGSVEGLTALVASNPNFTGRIAVEECTEDNIPSHLSAQFDKEKTREENISFFIKRAGENGVVLMKEGKRILRFTKYDQTGTVMDIRVQHDNADEVKVANAKAKVEKAEL